MNLPNFFTENYLIIALFILVAFALFAYFVYKKEQGIEEKENQILKDFKKILTGARGAEKKANELVVQDLDHALRESQKRHIEKFDAVSDVLLVDYEKSITSMQNQFLTASQQKFLQMDSVLNKTIEESLKKIDENAEHYKEEQIKKIREKTNEIFINTYRDVLGKSISVTVHNDLVILALEKAQKEGAFEKWQTKE